jgi:hypothetical protein
VVRTIDRPEVLDELGQLRQQLLPLALGHLRRLDADHEKRALGLGKGAGRKSAI